MRQNYEVTNRIRAAGRTLGFPDAEPAHGPRDAGDPDGLVRIVQNSVQPGRMANSEISTDRSAADVADGQGVYYCPEPRGH